MRFDPGNHAPRPTLTSPSITRRGALRPSSRAFASRLLGLLAAAAALTACESDPDPTPVDVGTVDAIMGNLPASCAFDCSECNEPAQPFACPTLKPWATLPHAAECGGWSGTYPSVTPGKCSVSDATGEAARKAGALPSGGVVLPDGHRIMPEGREVLLNEPASGDDPTLSGGFPTNILAIPGTRLALLSDGGIQDNALRLIDIDDLAGNAPPVKAAVPFPRPASLYYGMEWLPPGAALASGGGDGMIYAFDVDTAAGTLARAPSRDIALGGDGKYNWYSGAIAATKDGTRLVVAPADRGEEILIFSLAAADYGTKLASIPASGAGSIFDLRLDPFDASGAIFYASDQGQKRLIEIDGVKGAITRTVPLEKNPAQIAFLDATYMVVAEADADSIALIDRAQGAVAARVPVFEKDSPRGFSPSALSYDPVQKRLFAALASVSAVEVYNVAAGAPPTITPAGRVPTGWWPTAVLSDTDGALIIVNGKGHGGGTDGAQYPWSQGPITDRMRGSVQHVPAAALGSLSAMTAVVDQNRDLGGSPGRPEVTCPEGADDFPIPIDNKSGPSKQIKHVIFLVRENKTYDAIFGDRADLGDGDPTLIMASDVELQDNIWKNARAIAEQFTNFDNFYTDAEQSLQGHTWTAYGRINDYMERAWLTVWGRGSRAITTPLTALASPEEGSIFTWLATNGVDYDNMGEIVGGGPNPTDSGYPGILYAQSLPDTDKSCYMAGRARITCDLKPFTYAVQPNDHTFGGQAGVAAPEVMIAVNDEATGMLLDGLSHSPYWADSLLIVTEDDPQDGGDHIDLHRSILLMASPWIRRGYVSHGHYDVASIYKLVAHIYGIPYNNEQMRNALLPLDAFTSTPDYTPYTYSPRTVDAPCNPEKSAEAKEAEQWDFEDIDDQPGLSQQIMAMLRKPRAERGVRIVKPAPR